MAELKPFVRSSCKRISSMFPRHHSRGRIEAEKFYLLSMTTIRGFHGITAVAELKRDEFVHRDLSDGASFHGITAVAELKRCSVGFRSVDVAIVSTASQPWPN